MSQSLTLPLLHTQILRSLLSQSSSKRDSTRCRKEFINNSSDSWNKKTNSSCRSSNSHPWTSTRKTCLFNQTTTPRRTASRLLTSSYPSRSTMIPRCKRLTTFKFHSVATCTTSLHRTTTRMIQLSITNIILSSRKEKRIFLRPLLSLSNQRPRRSLYHLTRAVWPQKRVWKATIHSLFLKSQA